MNFTEGHACTFERHLHRIFRRIVAGSDEDSFSTEIRDAPNAAWFRRQQMYRNRVKHGDAPKFVLRMSGIANAARICLVSDVGLNHRKFDLTRLEHLDVVLSRLRSFNFETRWKMVGKHFVESF